MPEIILNNLQKAFIDIDKYKQTLKELVTKYNRITGIEFFETYAIISIADRNSLDPFVKFMRKELGEAFSFVYKSSRSVEILQSFEV